MATPIPLWKKSIDDALASGKNTDAMRAKLSNNPANSVVYKNALEYLNSKSSAPKLPDATTGPYTKQTADNATSNQSNPQPTYVQPSNNPAPVVPIQSGDYSI